jgi:Spy/CpxP family protein refolding chaperone
MKAKKTLVLTLLFSTLCVVTSLAQGRNGGGTPEERATKATERLKKSLNLTDGQVTQVQNINLSFFKEQEQARANQSNETDRDQRRAEMKARMDKHDVDLQKVLTPEQYKKYLADKEKEAKWRQNRQNTQDQGEGSPTM